MSSTAKKGRWAGVSDADKSAEMSRVASERMKHLTKGQRREIGLRLVEARRLKRAGLNAV